VPLTGNDGVQYGVVCTLVDVTERQLLESQLRQAQKMEAIGTLAGGIAHDFNNILGAIQGYTQLAKADTDQQPEVQSYLESVLQGTRRATNLVKQIITFTRMNVTQPVATYLPEIVTEAMELLRPTIPATIAIHASFEPDISAVMADPTQMHQIVVNLCTNAWHAMKGQPNGTLTVKLSNVLLDDAFAKVHLDVSPGLYVKLSVSDTGSGMDNATLARIFEPFFTTKAPGAGTGLGLAVVHGILKNHHGAIEVHSTLGQGTTFELYFPVCELPAARAQADMTKVPRGNGECILFVDDEIALANFGSTALEKLGYVVKCFTDAQTALVAFKAAPYQYDLVVTDYAMPNMSGTVLAEKLHALKPDMPLILVSGYIEDSSNALNAKGISQVIAKPYTIEAIGMAIHQLVVHRSRN
jgi:nitrogen-specific signal transduction histidine kinase/CheY-like chemotaxis protein